MLTSLGLDAKMMVKRYPLVVTRTETVIHSRMYFFEFMGPGLFLRCHLYTKSFNWWCWLLFYLRNISVQRFPNVFMSVKFRNLPYLLLVMLFIIGNQNYLSSTQFYFIF